MFPWTADLAAACYSLYETADGGWLALGALEPKFWRSFCEQIGRPDLAPMQHAEGSERQRIHAEVQAVMRTRTRDAWLTRFADADACLTAVVSRDDALADPHVAARGIVTRQDGVVYLAPPGTTVRPAPALGADTDAVLEAAGIGLDVRTRLRASGVL